MLRHFPHRILAQCRFERKALGSAVLEKNDTCIACLAAPPKGSLFAWGESGGIEKWILAKSKQGADAQERVQQSSEGQWVITGRCKPSNANGAKVTAVDISMDGCKVMTADTVTALRVWSGRNLTDFPTCEQKPEPGREPILGLCFSPSGHCVLALTGDGVVQVSFSLELSFLC